MAYSFYRSVTVDATKVSGDQTDFPVLVSVTDVGLKSVANGGNVQSANGYDISFGGLKYEIERYTPTTGEVVAWVKVPALSSSVNTTFYMIYGNAAITTDISEPTNVWTNSFTSVYHMRDGTTLSVLDSLAAHNGTNTNGVTAGTGQIDGCGSFASASTQYIAGGSYAVPTAITLSAWIKGTTFPNAYNTILGGVVSGANQIMYVKGTGKLAYFVVGSAQVSADGTGTNTLIAGTWYYVVMTYDSTTGLRGYVNSGTTDATAAANGAINTTSRAVRIGSDAVNASREFNGLIDEARIATVVRTSGWILTEYNNQNNPGSFLTLGTETAGSINIASGNVLLGHTSGYYTIADLDDTTPQPNLASSGAATEDQANYRPFLWPILGISPGITHDTDGGSKETWGIIGT